MPQDILITPYKDSTSSGAKIEFTGLNSGASTITMRVLSDSTLSYEGSAGQLFSISNGLNSGTIFSVNDISGVPSIDVVASGLIRLAPFVGEVQTNKLYVQANPQSGTQTVQEWRNLSGTAMASINTSGQFAGYLASGTGVGGSSGQIQFNAGGTIGGSAALTFSSGGPNLGITTQSTGVLPFRITTASGHTTNSLEVYHSGALSAYITPDGFLGITQNYGGTQKSNTLINGGLGAPTTQYRSVVIGTSASITAAASTGEAVAIGYAATVYANHGIAIGQSTGAGNTSIAIGLQAVANGADRSIAIGYLTYAPYSFSCAFGSRANTTTTGQFLWATESVDPSILLQRFSSANTLRGTFNITSTWISNTDGSTSSRVVLGPMYASSQQEAIRMDSASDLARVGIGGAASGRLSVYTGAATNKGVVIQGFTSQTANLQEWQNSALTNLAYMNASGAMIANFGGFGGAVPSGSYKLDVTGAANIGGTLFDGSGNATFPVNSAGSYVSSVHVTNTTKGYGVYVSKNNGGDTDSSISAFYADVTNTYANNPACYIGVSNSPGCKIFIAKGSASQTANLSEWQNSAGTVLMAVAPGATLVFAANTPNISGTVSNLVTSGSYYVRLNCTWSGSALTGIAPPTGLSQVDGKIMRLINAGTQPMKLTNMATSTATNRFACYNSGDLWMSPNDYYECTYDSTAFNGTSSGGAWRIHA